MARIKFALFIGGLVVGYFAIQEWRLINEIDKLGAEEKRILSQSYPGTDFSKCWIIEEGRKPAGKAKVGGLFSASFLMIGLPVVWTLRNRGA